MALAIPGFNAATVREGFRLPMQMAMPNDPDRWPEFVKRAIPADADIAPDGIPFDPSQAVAPGETTSHRPLCAIEWMDPPPRAENFGTVTPMVAQITLLDEEYELVEGFDYVNLWQSAKGGPVKFYFSKILQQVNLDVVGVWTIEVSTEDGQ